MKKSEKQSDKMILFWEVLRNSGHEPPIKGDELPVGYVRRKREPKQSNNPDLKSL